MYHDFPGFWKRLLQEGLTEDGWPWDWTTLGIPHSGRRVTAKVIARREGVWAAQGLIRCLSRTSAEIEILKEIPDGHTFSKDQTVLELRGPLAEIFALERPFLNLAAYAGGIATETRKFAQLIQKACPKKTPRLVLTRKTLPGYRDLCIHSVICGGGMPHRISLAGGVLIKENHIAAAGGIGAAVKAARTVSPHGLKIECEVRSLGELKEALQAKADGVLLDNFTPAEVKKSLSMIEKGAGIVVEVSGGLNESNVGSYSLPGVDILSVGSLTHSVKALDLSWLVQK